MTGSREPRIEEAAAHLAAEKRAAFKAAVEALKARVEEDALNVKGAMERARAGLEEGTAKLAAHRWQAFGVAVALGLILGTRRARRRRREAEQLLDAAEERRLVLVREQPIVKRTLWRSWVGSIGGLVLRQLASLAVETVKARQARSVGAEASRPRR